MGIQPPAGTKCVEPCIFDSGRWGSSYCTTDTVSRNWGAECVMCSSESGKKVNKEFISQYHILL